MEMTLMRRACESDSVLDSEKDSDSDCESDRNSKNDIASERNVIVSINTVQSLITSAPRCDACHEPVRLVEYRKKAVGLACFLKIEFSNQKCKQTDNNPTMPMAKKRIFL